MTPRKRTTKKTTAKKPRLEFPLGDGQYISPRVVSRVSVSRGSAVVQVRRALGLSPSSVFDDEAREVLVAWQEAAGLPVTGVVGREDWDALFGASAPATGRVDGAEKADATAKGDGELQSPEGAQ